MQRFDLTQKDIEQIQNNDLSIEYWYFQLRVGYTYEFLPNGIQFRLPYEKIGPCFWIEIENTIRHFICSNGEPRTWVKELLEGDIRDLIINIVTALTSRFDVGLGIVIPVVAIILKNGMLNFCSIQQEENADVDIKSFIEEKKLKF